MKGKISTIVPAYNAERTIDFCIRSIENQTYSDLEIVIVDDGSTDSTMTICRELQKEYGNIVLVNQCNQGPGKARENGFAHSSGDYISFVDADDYIDSNTYEIVIDSFEHSGAEIIQFGYYEEYPGNNDKMTCILPKYISAKEEESFHYFILQKYCKNYLWNKVYKRELFENIIWPNFYYSEDYALLAQLYGRAETVATIEYSFYHYVQNMESASNKPFSERKLDQIKAGYFVLDFAKNMYPKYDSLAYFWIATHSARLAEEANMSCLKNRKELTKYCLETFADSYKEMNISMKNGSAKVTLDKTTTLYGIVPRLALTLKCLLKK